MADDERRAEIEAVAEALWRNNRLDGKPEGYPYDRLIEPTRADLRRLAEAAISALDRVRDARGDDECNCYSSAFNDPMQHAPTCPFRDARGDDEVSRQKVIAWLWQVYGEAAQQEFRRAFPARSPQDEDHERKRIVQLEDALRQIVQASGPDCTVEGQIAAQALYDKGKS